MKLRKRRQSSLNFGRTRRKFNVTRFKYIMTWAVEILAVILFAFILVSTFGIRTSVVGQAMSGTLENGDEVFINKLIKNPKSGDVVVFLPNGNEKSHYYIRRVIGVPGDTIQIRDGAVYINGALYDEKIDVAAMEDTGIAGEEIRLAEDEYFVLGDNRNNSEDSRYANIGNIKKAYIAGTAWYRVKSESGTGFIH